MNKYTSLVYVSVTQIGEPKNFKESESQRERNG